MKAIKTALAISLCMFVIMGCISPELRTARIAVNEKDWNRALKALDRETERNPINFEAFYLKGLCYERLSDWENMSINYEKSLALSDQFAEDIRKSRKRLVIRYQNRSIIKWDVAKSMKSYGEKAGAEAILSRALEYIAVEVDGYFNGIIVEIEEKYGKGIAENIKKKLNDANILSATKLLMENVRTVRDKENAVPLLLEYFADWAQTLKDGTQEIGMLDEDETKEIELTIKSLHEARKQASGWKAEGGIELLHRISEIIDAFSSEFGGGSGSEGKSSENEVIDLTEYEKMWEVATGVTDVSDVFRSSLSSLDTAIIIDPNNRDLHVRAAVIADDGELFNESIEYAQHAIDLETEGEYDPAMRTIQMQAYKHKEDDDKVIESAKEVMRVIDLEKDDPNLYLQAFDAIVNIYESRGETDLARKTTEETLAKFPDNLLLKKNLAIFMIRRKDYDEAKKIYEDVLAKAPDDLDANLTIGTIHCNKEEYKDAIPYLIKAHEADSNNIAAVTNLMSAYYNSGQDEKGAEMREKLEALTGGE